MAYLSVIEAKMQYHGAKRIIFKPLANNDNSKQQIYLGSDFDVIRTIPSGEVRSHGMSEKMGPIFKAPLNFHWIDSSGNIEHAPNSQIILYPNYPEIRMSGFISGTNRNNQIVPRHLMQPPTPEERRERINKNRYLILGINDESSEIFAYCTSWDDEAARELSNLLNSDRAKNIASVFYEKVSQGTDSEQQLLDKLKEVYLAGSIYSCRLTADGVLIPYSAQNGAGYTLEAQFNITPNGYSAPDFMDWELKSHSGTVVTLMTPEPNSGIYIEDGIESFLFKYATSRSDDKFYFASRHKVNEFNTISKLTMRMEGYDPDLNKITDADGGLVLRDEENNKAAGWSFEKLIDHWKRKHTNTCYVSCIKHQVNEITTYQYGPHVTLGKGTNLNYFLSALYSQVIYYDPGINIKLKNGRWHPKKRNQFRVKWVDIAKLYNTLETIDLSKI